MNQFSKIPAVLILSGNDPTGGAGIAADIQALASMGCHAAPVITALTIQDTTQVYDYTPVDAFDLITQARTVLSDMTIDAIKIGMVGDTEGIEAIHSLLTDFSEIPVVLDPILISGAGDELIDAQAREAMIELLLPHATVLTPNSDEARTLAPGADTLDAMAHQLMAEGCDYVLITGTHRRTPQVINTLYGNMKRLDEFIWPRLPDTYHGSGCTLAASIAGMLAHGNEPMTAIQSAQDYTYKTLQHAFHNGAGQLIPDRLFWARDENDE